MAKNMPASTGDIRDAGLIPGLGRLSGGGHGNALHILAWRIPWTEKPGRLYSSWGRKDSETTETT